MDGEEEITSQSETVTLEAERIHGALDAVSVFAAGARDAYQNGRADFGDACLADARDCFTQAIDALPKAELNDAQLQHLKTRLDDLRVRLGRLHEISTHSRGEAA